MNKSVAMNVAITFGRLGLVNSQYMAQQLDNVAKQFALSIKILKDGEEKRSAFT
jgi:hypothetical protein